MTINTVELATMAGGLVQELFDAEMARVVTNILNPDMPEKATRKITIELRFTPVAGRTMAVCDASVNCKLAQRGGVRTEFWIDQDYDSGNITLTELDGELPGQTTVDERTGEVLDFPQAGGARK